MRRLAALTAALLPPLFALAEAAPGAGPAAGLRGAPTRDLLVIAEQALSQGEAAVRQAPGWMGSAHSRHAALAAALADMRLRLGKVRAGWAGRDPALPQSLRRGSVALAALRVAWGRSGLEAPQAARRFHALAAAYDALRARHGPEAARLARSGELTPAEAAQLRRLQEARAGLAALLGPLRTRAAARGDRALATELDRWAAQSRRLAAAEPSLDTLLAAAWLADQLAGEWSAAAPYLPGGPDLHAAHDAIEEVLGESEVGYLFLADLGSDAESGPEGRPAPDAAAATPRSAPVDGARSGAAPGAAAAGMVEGVRAAEGMEVAILDGAGGRLEDDGAAAGALDHESEGGPDGEWQSDLLMEWEDASLDWQEGQDEEVPEVEPESAAPGATEPEESEIAEAPGATPEDAAASFEVVTDSGEVLVVEIGPDDLRTRAKQPAPQDTPTAAPPVAPKPPPPL